MTPTTIERKKTGREGGHTMINNEHTQDEEPVQDCDCRRCAISERERFRAALEKIANTDYRWNRSQESTIAYKALNNE